jgi:hypothetical protein
MTADPFPTGPHRPVRIPHLPPLRQTRAQRRESKDDANAGRAPGRRTQALPEPEERGDLHA